MSADTADMSAKLRRKPSKILVARESDGLRRLAEARALLDQPERPNDSQAPQPGMQA